MNKEFKEFREFKGSRGQLVIKARKVYRGL
ncbi:hypothetical protein V475_23720 [Sphingobium baderi LL03]|nr:hypothetical protein V475_23720 [Sphingobium baderi LL03]